MPAEPPDNSAAATAAALTPDLVRKVAKLARLAPSDAQLALYATQLSAVLGYVDRLKQLNLSGVEPMPHVGGEVNRLDDDNPGPTIPNQALMAMAPDRMEPFVKVPKVLGEGGGA